MVGQGTGKTLVTALVGVVAALAAPVVIAIIQGLALALTGALMAGGLVLAVACTLLKALVGKIA